MALMVMRSRTGLVFEPITEDLVDTARDLGWELIARESEIPYVPRVFIEPSQSNPRRVETEDD
jgi:hypothetical protein